jgi:hypothetical protein
MNLDSRIDRWIELQTEFRKLQCVVPIDLCRVSAISNEIPQYGVTKTIHNIIKTAKESNNPYVLVIEDDLRILDAERIISSLENAPNDWDILSGGVYLYSPIEKYNDYWMRVKDFCGLHFIIIRNTVYNRILDINSQTSHIDRILGAQVKCGHIKMYVMFPMLCQQKVGYSNVKKSIVNYNNSNLPWQAPKTDK